MIATPLVTEYAASHTPGVSRSWSATVQFVHTIPCILMSNPGGVSWRVYDKPEVSHDFIRDSGQTLRASRLYEVTEADEAARIGETWSVLSILESWVKEGGTLRRPWRSSFSCLLRHFLCGSSPSRATPFKSSSIKDNLAIDAPVDEPLAKHLPYPYYFTLDLRSRSSIEPLLLPLKSSFSFSRLQVLLPLIGTPVLRK